MITRNKPKVAKIDSSLYKDIVSLQKQIERKTCCAVSFRRASELYVQTNTKKIVKVNMNGTIITIQRRT